MLKSAFGSIQNIHAFDGFVFTPFLGNYICHSWLGAEGMVGGFVFTPFLGNYIRHSCSLEPSVWWMALLSRLNWATIRAIAGLEPR